MAKYNYFLILQLWKICLICIDDKIIYSKNFEYHLAQLNRIFDETSQFEVEISLWDTLLVY